MPAIVSQCDNTCLGEILTKLDEVKADVIENGDNIEQIINMLPEPTCPSGWILKFGKCYKFTKDKKSWQEAEDLEV